MSLRLGKAQDEDGWQPAYLEQAAKESRAILTDVQYEYAVEQTVQLCEERDPTHPIHADVDQIYDFHELRLKGGVLGKTNLRIYFYMVKDLRMLIVLGVWNKGAEGQTPVRITARMKARMKHAERYVAALREQVQNATQQKEG